MPKIIHLPVSSPPKIMNMGNAVTILNMFNGTDSLLYACPCKDGILTDWYGNRLGTWRTISSRPAVFFGRHSGWHHTYYYMRATLDNGATYSLRGFGVGTIASGKRIKGA